MATYVQKFYTGQTIYGTSIAVTVTAAAVGDLLIAFLTERPGGGTPSAPSGWTLLEYRPHKSDVSVGVWWKLADSSDVAGAPHTWTWPTSTQPSYLIILEYSGAATIAAHSGLIADSDSSGNTTGPTVTATKSNQTALMVEAPDLSPNAGTAPAGWVARQSGIVWERTATNAAGDTLGGGTWHSPNAGGDYFAMALVAFGGNPPFAAFGVPL